MRCGYEDYKGGGGVGNAAVVKDIKKGKGLKKKKNFGRREGEKIAELVVGGRNKIACVVCEAFLYENFHPLVINHVMRKNKGERGIALLLFLYFLFILNWILGMGLKCI